MTSEEKVKQFVVNYSALIIECAMNPDYLEKFKKKPVQILNEQVGMAIPDKDSVKVIIDLEDKENDRIDNNFRWPIIWVFFKNQSVKVEYQNDGKRTRQNVDAIRFNEALDVKAKPGEMIPIIKLQEAEVLKNDTIPGEVMEKVKEAGIELKTGCYVSPQKRHDGNHALPILLEDCLTVIILPFIDVKSDPLSHYKFLDGDIVLSPCC